MASFASLSSTRPRMVACAGSRVPTETLLVKVAAGDALRTTTTSRPSRITSWAERPVSSRKRSMSGRASSATSSDAMYSNPETEHGGTDAVAVALPLEKPEELERLREAESRRARDLQRTRHLRGGQHLPRAVEELQEAQAALEARHVVSGQRALIPDPSRAARCEVRDERVHGGGASRYER